MTTINVRSGDGRLVKDPRGRVVPAEFSVDPLDPFWSRLLADGDVVQIRAQAAPAASDRKGAAS